MASVPAITWCPGPAGDHARLAQRPRHDSLSLPPTCGSASGSFPHGPPAAGWLCLTGTEPWGLPSGPSCWPGSPSPAPGWPPATAHWHVCDMVDEETARSRKEKVPLLPGGRCVALQRTRLVAMSHQLVPCEEGPPLLGCRWEARACAGQRSATGAPSRGPARPDLWPLHGLVEDSVWRASCPPPGGPCVRPQQPPPRGTGQWHRRPLWGRGC